jgi:hypothetical protein
MERALRTVNIEDPALQHAVNQFYTHCYIPARSKFLEQQPAAAAPILAARGGDDVDWIGSHVYRTVPGFYDTLDPGRPIPGIPVNLARETDRFWEETTGSIDHGIPLCNEWWGSHPRGPQLNRSEPTYRRTIESAYLVPLDGDRLKRGRGIDEDGANPAQAALRETLSKPDAPKMPAAPMWTDCADFGGGYRPGGRLDLAPAPNDDTVVFAWELPLQSGRFLGPQPPDLLKQLGSLRLQTRFRLGQVQIEHDLRQLVDRLLECEPLLITDWNKSGVHLGIRTAVKREMTLDCCGQIHVTVLQEERHVLRGVIQCVGLSSGRPGNDDLENGRGLAGVEIQVLLPPGLLEDEAARCNGVLPDVCTLHLVRTRDPVEDLEPGGPGKLHVHAGIWETEEGDRQFFSNIRLPQLRVEIRMDREDGITERPKARPSEDECQKPKVRRAAKAMRRHGQFIEPVHEVEQPLGGMAFLRKRGTQCRPGDSGEKDALGIHAEGGIHSDGMR